MRASKTLFGLIAFATVIFAAPTFKTTRAMSVGIIGNEAIVEGFTEDIIHEKERPTGLRGEIIGNEAIVEGFNEDLMYKEKPKIIGNNAIIEGFNEDLM
ncbi:hypothetical protein ACMFMG_009832 [Clarireedia jacksonii]